MRIALGSTVFCVVACGARSYLPGEASQPVDAGDTRIDSPAACVYATGVQDSRGGSVDKCTGYRFYVTCTFAMGNGVTGEATCLSDHIDPTTCARNNNLPDGATCVQQCTHEEYGLACGSLAGSQPQPPVGCRPVQVDSGARYYCCPCL
jgi:hypothetical protein